MPTPLRRAHTAVAVALAVVATLCVPAMAHATVQPRLIVGFESGASSAAQGAALGRSGATVKRRLPSLRAAVVTVRPGELARTRARLLARPDVRFVEIDHVARAYDLGEAAASGLAAQWHPNDTFRSQQWALDMIGAERAWEFSRGTGITVAVVDTGVDYIHPDLRGRVDLGRDFVDGDADPMDVQGHGTHVAGIAAGSADDSFGIAGVAPGARILAVRVLDAEGAGNYSQVADGIVYAAQHGAKVINLSLGGDEASELLRAAIDYAAARGAIVTCATGNEGAEKIGFPARYESCTAVGATTPDDDRADFSNRGSGIDLTAPGAQILSSVMGGSHDAWDGTSMATPHVAGLAALLEAQGLGRRAVLDVLSSTAVDRGPAGADTTYGAGRIDAAAAAEQAARMPRAIADAAAPAITQLEVLPVRRRTTTSWSTRWKVRSRTAFRRIGTSEFRGTTSYSETRMRGRTRTIRTTRFRGGVVYRRTIVQVKVRIPRRSTVATVPVRVTATDDVGVDRVAVSVDGTTVGVDWTASDGWLVEVPCSTKSRTIAASAFDVADHEVASSVVRRTGC